MKFLQHISFAINYPFYRGKGDKQMKRKTLKRSVLTLLLATMIASTGCGSNSKNSAEYATDSYNYATDDFYSNGVQYNVIPSEDAMEESEIGRAHV